MPRTVIFYVKGVGNGRVSCLWRTFIAMNVTDSPDSIYCGTRKDQSDASAWITQYKTNAIPSEINPQLTEIPQGDDRIIVEVGICYRDGKNSEGKIVSLKDSLGLHTVTPKITTNSIANTYAIFTPKPGLFDETGFNIAFLDKQVLRRISHQLLQFPKMMGNF